MRNVDKKYHYLYKTTNLINEKYYYGMHSTQNLNDEYLGSGLILRRAIRKYGKDNFKREIIKIFDSREELVQGEIDLITDELLNEDLCMNLKPGGSGGFTNEQQKINAEKSNAKQKILRETNIEWVKKCSENKTKAQIKSYENGRKRKYFHNWIGKNHSEETKIKMSESSKGKCLGEKNGSYGTCWITNNIENKKIKKEELDQYIILGWSKGRKIK